MKEANTITKRTLAVLLTLLMLFSTVPLSMMNVSAADEWVKSGGEETIDRVEAWPTGTSSTAGFCTNHTLYKNYNKSIPSNTSTTKYEVVKKQVIGYLYWHWCYTHDVGEPINCVIRGSKNGIVSGSPKDHQTTNFHAFYSTSKLSYTASAHTYKYKNASYCPYTYWWVSKVYSQNGNNNSYLEVVRTTYQKYVRANPVTTHTVTYNYSYNGGTSATKTSATVAEGAAIDLTPTATKNGSTFVGWNTNASASNGLSSLNMGTSNVTLYAIFKNDNKKLTISDQYAFSNSSKSFRNGSYRISDSDFKKLANYVKRQYNSSYSQTLINDLQDFRTEQWGGSCYGMASTVLLDKWNQIGFNENFDHGKKTMHDVSAPYQNSQVESAINYYHISQIIPFTRKGETYSNRQATWANGLKRLVQKAQNGDLMLFCYFFSNSSGNWGHAIVIKGYQKASDGSFNLIAYDNRWPDKDIIVKVSSNYKTCVINGNENAYYIEFLSDLSCFNLIDIDGPNNDMNIQQSTSSGEVSNTIISVVPDGRIEITNCDDETLIIEDGDISGTMNVVSTHLIINENEDGSAAAAELAIEVKNSDSYAFESSSQSMSVSVQSNGIYASADTKNTDTIVFAENEGVYLLGDNMEYKTSLSVNNNLCDMVSLAGKADGCIDVTYENGSIAVKGIQGQRTNMRVYNNETEVNDYNLNSEYENNLITSNSSGDLVVLASEGADDNYNLTLLDTGNTQTNTCKWCGKTHGDDFVSKIIGSLHNIFAMIFGTKY